MTLIYDGIDHPVEISPGGGDLRYSSVPMMAPFTGAGGPGSVILAGGRQLSFAQLFATQPWVAAVVMRLLTWSIRVPLKCYRRLDDENRVRLRPSDHPLAQAIVNPWERGSQADLTMSLLGPLLVHGNALNPVDDGPGGQLRFDAADWRFARPIMPWRNTIAGWELNIDEATLASTRGADTVMHVKWWSPLGPIGTSPLQQLGVTLNIEDAAQRHQKSMLANGARPPSAVVMDEKFLTTLQPDERQALVDVTREDLNAIYAGPENSGRPALLPPGLDWKQVGHTAVEAALIDQRRLTRDETCAVYQVQPSMLGLMDKATMNNFETARQVSYADGLGPPLVLIEQTLNAQLVGSLLREDDVFLEYDFSGVLRGNRLQEVEALREAIATGLLTPNEARAIDNSPRSASPGMDAFYLPKNNLQPIGTIDGQPPQEPAPPLDTAPTNA